MLIRSGALAVLVSAAFGASWPEFRGPTAQGVADARNVPVHWSTTSNVTWKAALPGKGWSSPVLSEGKIYLTAALQDDSVSLRALCLDHASGKIIWDKEVFRAEAGATRQLHSKNSMASPTPIVRDGRLYTHFGHMGTAALDLEGNVLWTQTSIKYPPVHGNGGSPLLIGDAVVFNCDGASDPFIVALDAKDGKVRWKTPRNTTAKSKFSFSTPLELALDGERMIISPASGFVGAYDPANGRELWRVRYGEGYSVVPRPIFGNGLLFLSSGFDRPVVYGIDPKGAKADATETHVRWKQAKGAPNTPSLLLLGDELYMVSDGGIASCLDAKTGEAHWSERLGGNFSASPVAAEGRIYFVNEAGITSVVRASKQFELLAKNDLGERALASPAVDDGALFIRTESHLWRLGR